MYSSLVRPAGLIVFHDVVDNPKRPYYSFPDSGERYGPDTASERLWRSSIQPTSSVAMDWAFSPLQLEPLPRCTRSSPA
jgi:hypothetical protein